MTLQAEYTILRRGAQVHSRYVLDDECINDTERETLLICDVWAYRLKLSGDSYKVEVHDEAGDDRIKVVYLDAERDEVGDLESWGLEVNGQNTGDTYQDLRDVLDDEGFEIGDTLWVKFTSV